MLIFRASSVAVALDESPRDSNQCLVSNDDQLLHRQKLNRDAEDRGRD